MRPTCSLISRLVLGLALCVGSASCAEQNVQPPNVETTVGSSYRLKDQQSEVEVTLAPQLRVLSFKSGELPNLLFQDPDNHNRSGLRFVALEKTPQGGQRALPLSAGAIWQSTGSDAGELEATDPTGQLHWKLYFQLQGGTFEVRIELENRGEEARALAPWAIASVDPKGWLATAFGRGQENRQWSHARLVAFWRSSLSNPSLRLGATTLAIDFSRWNGKGAWKYGTRSLAGWAAAVRPDLGAGLLARFPYTTGDSYPDENCNVTFYAGKTPGGLAYGEMEWLGPWTRLAPGQSLRWHFALELIAAQAKITSPDDLTALVLAPQTWQLPRSTALAGTWRLAAAGPLVRDRFDRVTAWQDAKGQTVADTPLWFNAPVWDEQGPSLLWTQDTIVSVKAETLPAWTSAGRSWDVEFASDSPDGPPQLLLQEGDDKAGVLLLVQGKMAEAWLWQTMPNGQVKFEQVKVPLQAGARQRLRARYAPQQQRFILQSGEEQAQVVSFAGEIAPPASTLRLGRNAQVPAGLGLRKPAPFTGKLYRVEISPRP